jgi:hypothetical protein
VLYIYCHTETLGRVDWEWLVKMNGIEGILLQAWNKLLANQRVVLIYQYIESIRTEAPITGSLSSADITVPDTSIWANAAPMLIKRQTKKSESLFSIISRLNLKLLCNIVISAAKLQ